MTPAQLLMQIWPKIQEQCPDLKFQIVPYENTPENAREILANLGKNIDVVGGIFDETMLDLRRCAGLEPVSYTHLCSYSARSIPFPGTASVYGNSSLPSSSNHVRLRRCCRQSTMPPHRLIPAPYRVNIHSASLY